MSEVNARRMGQLVRGVFQLLLNEPDGLPAKTVLERLSTLVPPTAFEQTFYSDRPNVRRYEKIVRFSTIAPVKAGWMVKNKGAWSLTDEGRAAYSRYSDPEQFTREARTLCWTPKRGPSSVCRRGATTSSRRIRRSRDGWTATALSRRCG